HAIKNASSSGGATVTAAADPFYQYEHSDDENIEKNNPDKAWDYDEKNYHCLAGDIEWGPGTSDDGENSFELQDEEGVTVSHFVDFDDAILQGSTLTGPVTVVVRNRWQAGNPHMYVSWCNDNDDPCFNKNKYEDLFDVDYSESDVTLMNSWELYSYDLCTGTCAGWTWDDLSNLFIRIINTGDKDGDLDIDHVYITFPRSVDTPTGTLLSGWTWDDASGVYKSGQLSFDKGTVETEITVSSTGVNVNYANQRLLETLFDECGLGSQSDNVAQNLISWRGSNGSFSSTAHVRQVLTDDYTYTDTTVDKFIDYISVFSSVNTGVYYNDDANPHDSGTVTRAPININTASELVIRAALDGIKHIESGNAEDLAQGIVDHRENVGPFAGISATAEEINSLHNFIWGKHYDGSYSVFLESDARYIDENMDASRRGHNTINDDDDGTTEFSVKDSTSGTYYITSTGSVGNISRSVQRTVYLNSSGNVIFDVPLSDGGTANTWEEIR
ncbi:MAG: helix-hairpin-helix domain-containing protein, partial [Deltaproteobacteria bacterium]|nr:helix-hairpin-helix domain-containing protein [Deltaproteobacteria bacterium]